VSATEDEKRRVEAVEADYPGSQVWVGPMSTRWSWRLIEGDFGPSDIVTGDDEDDLRAKIDAWLRDRAARINAATQHVLDTCIEALREELRDGQP
jgi:hypothetical protein